MRLFSSRLPALLLLSLPSRSRALSTLLQSPAAERNKGPILAALAEHSCFQKGPSSPPPRVSVLEIASGAGIHCAHLASSPDLPLSLYQPSDPSPACRESTDRRVLSSPSLRCPVPPSLPLSTSSLPAALPEPSYDLLLAFNLAHISPWPATLGLLSLAARALPPAGALVLYGPFLIAGRTAPSNRGFDASLRERDAEWGVRDLEEVEEAAGERGLVRSHLLGMPANNHLVAFQRR
ncbi:hypothetical protein TeGR_g411 [Tetraparma gracilis]|uniref:Uncharacterized protein n=1 Tax=Tetraparma gracilis TaxID=2962635 RepID=A0ABQ6MBZ7_9STRA|nr:hypothetical protein TeGR_g411 [Tetraparma gracilis]